MRTANAGMIAHLAAAGYKTLAACVRIDRRDGQTFGFTSHDEPLEVDLGDGALTYSALDGVVPSAIAQALGLDADNMEISGAITDLFTRPAILGGRWNRARVRVFAVNWRDTTGILRLLPGRIAFGKVVAGRYVFEVRSNADAYNQTIGRVLSPFCSNDLGVYNPPFSRCQKVVDTWDATVTAVTDDLRFEVSWDGAAPSAADVRNGLVTFNSGELAGTLPVEIFELAGGDTIDLYHPLVEAPQVGDTLTLTEGCDKTRPTCKEKGQMKNHAGFPDLIGTDALIAPTIPEG